MSETNDQINFHAPAILRKWPSIKNERISAADGAHPYSIVEGTLDNCIRQFMAKPVSQRHLYEIHTTPQANPFDPVLERVSIFRMHDVEHRS